MHKPSPTPDHADLQGGVCSGSLDSLVQHRHGVMKMSGIAELLTTMMSGSDIQNLSRNIGAQPHQASQAVTTAIPLLLGALSRNASRPGGAEALSSALERDRHDQLLGNIGGVLGGAAGGKAGAGDAILGHLLGNRRGSVEQAVGKASGLDMAQVSKLLAALAPLIMAGVGQKKQQGGLDAGGLADLLSGERRNLGSMDGLLGALLDGDGDGDVDASDIASKGMQLLGGFLKR